MLSLFFFLARSTERADGFCALLGGCCVAARLWKRAVRLMLFAAELWRAGVAIIFVRLLALESVAESGGVLIG